MDLLTFIKKKQPSIAKPTKQKPKASLPKRFDTEVQPINPKSQKSIVETPSSIYNNYQSSSNTIKYKINAKQLIQILNNLKTIVQNDYDQALSNKNKFYSENPQCVWSSDLFRIDKLTKEQVLSRYEKILQGCELFISKLKNNESIKQNIHVRNAEEFLLFFKSIFGKPYSFCNMDSNRKILQVLWQNQIFPNKKVLRCLDNLKLWIYGIGIPINPAAISLHKLVFQNPEYISKVLKFSKNQHLYVHVNKSDCMGMTSFLLAVKSITKSSNQKNIAIEKLIKSGCDIFCCPLTFSTFNGTKQKIVKQKKMNKIKFLIEYPIKCRKQTNAIQYLFSRKLFKNVADVLYYDQLRSIKSFRNDRHLQQQLLKIPDCSFQIDWKSYKGMLSFKSLPRDIISVYKKQNCFRIDYHVDDIQNCPKKPKNRDIYSDTKVYQEHYSLLLKAGSTKPELFLINHHNRKITDLLHQISPGIIKDRYNTLLHHGNMENQQIVSFKSQYNQEIMNMQTSVTFAYQNVKNSYEASQKYRKITNIKQYEQAILQSNLIDYATLQKSQEIAFLKQNFVNMKQIQQIKSKVVKNTLSFDAEWTKQKLNLRHIQFMLRLLIRRNPFIRKVHKIVTFFLRQNSVLQQKFDLFLPQKLRLNLENDLNIQAQIKNLSYSKLDNAVFSLDYKAMQNNFQYENQNQVIASLQSTVVMDELYSLNVSNFLGKSQKLLDLQDQQANEKFNEMLLRDMNSNSDDQRKQEDWEKGSV